MSRRDHDYRATHATMQSETANVAVRQGTLL
jgi:hypothetical protein